MRYLLSVFSGPLLGTGTTKGLPPPTRAQHKARRQAGLFQTPAGGQLIRFQSNTTCRKVVLRAPSHQSAPTSDVSQKPHGDTQL